MSKSWWQSPDTRKYLLKLVLEHFACEFVLSCNGYASMLTFKNNKASHLLLVRDIEGDEDLDDSIEKVAKQKEKSQ